MKVLVTGGAGFIGSHTVDLLLQKGSQVVIVDNMVSGRSLHKQAAFYPVDICSDLIDIVFRTEKPDYVIHLAAQTSVQESLLSPSKDAKVNAMGTIKLLESCIKHQVQKIVFASSAAIYGEPQSISIEENHPSLPLSNYGLSKRVAEKYIQMYARLYGLKYTILRYANVYGVRQSISCEGGVIAQFIHCLSHQKQPIVFGTGEQTRDFIYVKDIAAANVAALLRGENEVLNISCSIPTSINQLLNIMMKLAKRKVKPKYSKMKDGEILHSLLSNQKAKKTLNWKPKYTLSQGLAEMIYKQLLQREAYDEQSVLEQS